jgi:hypothetical protein
MQNGDPLQQAVETDSGLKVNGLVIEPIIDKCEGCERIREIRGVQYCSSYPKPAAKWRTGACNFATHVKATVDKEGKTKVNPLKASKRAARSKKK